ncbi:MAG TPA: hypothetical protein VK826_15670, partial [Bacteroidia bacterium]|nr:hypothetical protein [Bacteroidia bacterium]
MIWDDDDDDDFNWDKLSEEEKAAMDREQKEEEKRMRNHPLYKQAFEILNTVNAVIESLPEQDREFHSPMLESACMLAPKFAGVFECGDWLITVQNAALMRYHAAYIATGTYGFEMYGEVDMRYVHILRQEMESYKKVFNAWMKEVHV